MNIRLLFCACLISLTAGGGVSFAATQSDGRVNQWEAGPEIYYFQYKEPGLNVKSDGAMYGVAGSYTHHGLNRLMLKADSHAAWGEIDYHSTDSGSINGIGDYALEGRVLAGYDVRLKKGENRLFTPFFGIGYRHLNDDSSGRTSSEGDRGYERESNYFYSPLGAEFSTKLNAGWKLIISAEYDILWEGKQESHLEDVHFALNTVSNDQDSGYGVRGSAKLQKKGDRFDIVIEPFIRWWSIKESQLSNVTFTGVIVGYVFEPKNETLEIGGKIAALF